MTTGIQTRAQERSVSDRSISCYVRALSLAVLGRPATPAEVQDWVTLAGEGTGRRTIASLYLRSLEQTLRRRSFLARRLLGRLGEMVHQKMPVQLGMREEECTAILVSSEGYARKVGATTDAFLSGLFRDLLERTADAMELVGWCGLLDSGSGNRRDVALELMRSDEYRRKLIRQWHLDYLGREPDRASTSYWMDRLRAGMPSDEAEVEILSSEEFFARAQTIGRI